jgi:hypothetical protein
MRDHIIADTTRSVTFESEVVEINGIDRAIWNIVVRCPVNGISVCAEAFTSREKAVEAWGAMA